MNSETAVIKAASQGLLCDGRHYSKSDLLTAFDRAGLSADEANRAFVGIRTASSVGTTLGRLSLATVGERRGKRYSFGGLNNGDNIQDIPPEQSEPTPMKTTQQSTTYLDAQTDVTCSATDNLDIYYGDNLQLLQQFPDESFDLIYIDPPFNTGKTQERTRIRTVRDQENGDRTGFQGKRYRTVRVGSASFADAFSDFIDFLEPRLVEARRLLSAKGSFFLHIDYREAHYCKILLDHIFGRECFQNEIIWAYDYGARTKKKWSTKHDNILWYVKDANNYVFNFDEMDRIPYMAPGLVGKEKAERGKTPTDVWWHTIVPTNGKERTGYPTQKPVGILNRIVKVHTRPGDRVLDFFAGSGTTGESACNLGRSCVLIDNNEEALSVMAKRFSSLTPSYHGWENTSSNSIAYKDDEQSPTKTDDDIVSPSIDREPGDKRQQSLF